MKLLVCVDGSQYSDNAIQFLAERPWRSSDSIEVITVAETVPVEFGLGSLPNDSMKFDKALSDDCKQIAESAAKTLKEKLPDVAIKATVLEGYITETICKKALETNTDLIVLGSHGRTGFQKLILGSVAEEVLKNAPCTVEVVRPKLDESNETDPLNLKSIASNN